jgi:hypothetical protein
VATVDLKTAADLPRVQRLVCLAIEDRTLAAMREAASWGHAQAVSATQKSRLSATRTFAMAWFDKPTAHGAIVGNSAAHATFVERGRNPGKMPPTTAIEKWIEAKGLVGKAKGVSRKAARKAVIGKGPSGNISGAKQRARLNKDIARRSKIYRSEPAKKYRRQLEIAAMALGIARKIAAKGTTGRYILRDLAPRMARRFWRTFGQRLKQLSASPPR